MPEVQDVGLVISQFALGGIVFVGAQSLTKWYPDLAAILTNLPGGLLLGYFALRDSSHALEPYARDNAIMFSISTVTSIILASCLSIKSVNASYGIATVAWVALICAWKLWLSRKSDVIQPASSS